MQASSRLFRSFHKVYTAFRSELAGRRRNLGARFVAPSPRTSRCFICSSTGAAVKPSAFESYILLCLKEHPLLSFIPPLDGPSQLDLRPLAAPDDLDAFQHLPKQAKEAESFRLDQRRRHSIPHSRALLEISRLDACPLSRFVRRCYRLG